MKATNISLAQQTLTPNKTTIIMTIELIKILVSIALSAVLFYTFRKVGRKEILDSLLKHLSEANKIIAMQEVIIQSYRRDLKQAKFPPLTIDYDPSVRANDFVDSLLRLFCCYGDKPVFIGEVAFTSIVYSEDRKVFTPVCSPDSPPMRAFELSSLTKQLVRKYGNLSVEPSKQYLLDITFDKDADIFRIGV